jgi:spore maturation protein CgeB
MRWLVCRPGPAFSVFDVCMGWLEALRGLGEDVHEFRFDDRLNAFAMSLREEGEAPDGLKRFRRMYNDEQVKLLAADGLCATLFKVRPDVLLLISAFYLPPALLEHIQRSGIAVVIIHTESPYEDVRQLKLAPYAHLNLLNDPANIDQFTAVAPAMYLPHAYRPTVHHPAAPGAEQRYDFSFVGTAFASRIEFFEQLDLDGLDVLLAGNWQQLADDSPLYPFLDADPAECMDNADTADVYRESRVGINFYRREAEHPELSAGVAMGPREVEMAACGLFFLRDPRPEGDEVLDMLPRFTCAEEASALLRWYLDRPGERQVLADKAREAVADRTFDQHARALLAHIIP